MIPIAYLSLMVPTNLLFHLAFVGWHKLRPTAAQAQGALSGINLTSTAVEVISCKKPGSFWRNDLFSQRIV